MTVKELSRKHESDIAKWYNGSRSASSGASQTDKGDVRIESSKTLFECKLTGSPGNKSKRTTLLGNMEKIADEAWIEGKHPAVALRIFCPESPLAGHEGWVDLVVRLAKDDSEREAELYGD